VKIGSLKQEVVAAGCSIALYYYAPLVVAVNPCTHLSAVALGVAVYAIEFGLRVGLNKYGASRAAHLSVKPLCILTIAAFQGSLHRFPVIKILFLLLMASLVNDILLKIYGPFRPIRAQANEDLEQISENLKQANEACFNKLITLTQATPAQ